jgi:hypothetical protein
MEKFKENYKNLSDKSLITISAIISVFTQYRYLKKNHVFYEYNGHFNSPQNKFNRSQIVHHWKDVTMRAFLVFSISYLATTFTKNYLIGFDKVIEDGYKEEEKQLRKKLEEERKRFKSIVIEGEDERISLRKFNTINEVKNRDKVDKYLEN